MIVHWRYVDAALQTAEWMNLKLRLSREGSTAAAWVWRLHVDDKPVRQRWATNTAAKQAIDDAMERVVIELSKLAIKALQRPLSPVRR